MPVIHSSSSHIASEVQFTLSLMLLLATGAVILPTLLAHNLPPSATFYNQALALGGWGALCCWLGWVLPAPNSKAAWPLRALLGALALLAVAALTSPLWTGLPWGLALGPACVVAAAALVVVLSWRAGIDAQHAEPAFRALCWALAAAGGLSLLIAWVQVFAPGWADGALIAASATPGRAVGNLRQPNHLSTLFMLACAAVVWLGQDHGEAANEGSKAKPRRDVWAVAALVLLIWGVVLTASRTGVLGVLMLAGWGVLDKRLPRRLRIALFVAPLIYLAWWGAMALWSDWSAHAFVGEQRATTGGDISSHRFAIWANTLALIRTHPWAGVGFGGFNFAWTLTPFPGRPIAFFDHTHNLLLQFAVELGLPLAALVLGLLGWALWGLLQGARGARGEAPAGGIVRTALFMVLLAGVHSLLEYPLWYAYFLLPVMFAWGLGLGAGASEPASPLPAVRQRRLPVAAIAGALLSLGALWSVGDYGRVAVIYTPGDNAAPLDERIAAGQRSLFFAHQADYAAATTAEHPGKELGAFARATHNLIDARLLRAWAEAEAEHGDLPRARYLAHRLREFRHPLGDEFFAACGKPRMAGEAEPFQCGPDAPLSYEDFR